MDCNAFMIFKIVQLLNKNNQTQIQLLTIKILTFTCSSFSVCVNNTFCKTCSFVWYQCVSFLYYKCACACNRFKIIICAILDIIQNNKFSKMMNEMVIIGSIFY